MLSVVIPVYNVQKYLDKCVDSVVRQTYKDLEILLINDGSTDVSEKICEKWEERDTRIRYITKENEGSGKTRNLGIKEAKGEYITFLDSDDWWDITYAEKMMQYAIKADIVICDMYYVDIAENGDLIENISKIRLPDRILLDSKEDIDIINKGRTFLCGKVFKTEMFYKYHIEQPTMLINDIPIVPLMIALSEKICRVGEPLYYYLRGRSGNTVTSVNALKSFGMALRSMKENFDAHEKTIEYEKALQKMYYSQVRFAMKKAIAAYRTNQLEKNEYDEIRAYLFESIADFWEKWPDIENKKIGVYEDKDVMKAVQNIVFDEKMIVSEKESDYYVLSAEEFEKQVNIDKKSHLIVVDKKENLSGEDLWWQMADEILFKL